MEALSWFGYLSLFFFVFCCQVVLSAIYSQRHSGLSVLVLNAVSWLLILPMLYAGYKFIAAILTAIFGG